MCGKMLAVHCEYCNAQAQDSNYAQKDKRLHIGPGRTAKQENRYKQQHQRPEGNRPARRLLLDGFR
jgi:hypothetical protein